MAKLVISKNDNMLGSRFLDTARISIGRASGNDIQLDDVSVSKQHAVIEVVGKDHILLDMGSSNGTYVNGGRVSRHMLRHGDIVEVRDFQLRYVDHKSVVNSEGDRTMVVARSEVPQPQLMQSPHGLVSSAAPAAASRNVTVKFAEGTIRIMAGGIIGKEVVLDRALMPIGKAGADRAAIFRRPDGFYIARVGGQPPKVNGKSVPPGWQPLSNRDFIECGSETVQIWINKDAAAA
ncbi:MAG TPA: FHA domain-containing protein [Burkholderiales bacterium]|nr:FHA domain-containing protein [Burkholderiales bacterium]